MKTKRLDSSKGVFLALLFLLTVVLGCRLGDKLFGSDHPVSSAAYKLPNYDPKSPPPALGLSAINLLSELDPKVREVESVLEATETAAFKEAIAKLPRQQTASNKTESPKLTLSDVANVISRKSVNQLSFSNAIFQAPDSGASAPNGNDAALLGVLLGTLSDMVAPALPPGSNKNASATNTNGDTSSKYDINFGRATDGTTTFGIGAKSETTKNGVTVKTELKGQLDGQRCPNAEGQVPFTVKAIISAESGGTAVTQELTSFVRALVNDDAQVMNAKVDLIAGTRQAKDGRAVYVETGLTYEYFPEGDAGPGVSNQRTIRTSQDATQDDINKLSSAGWRAAYGLALSALATAERAWQNGGCTRIDATAPGSVQPGSNTAIPVVVKHRVDGSDVPSKLDAELSGQQSVNPTRLPKTAGTITYTAPGESGQTATIKLTATSKRGRANLELEATTGSASYLIVGGLDAWQTSTNVCDIMKPFTLTGGGFTMQVSGGLSGTYSYTGPFNAHGTGTYTISLPEGLGKAGKMTGGGAGSAGGYTNTGTEKYTLTPIAPCK
jgi:hypothetical protein